MADVTGSNWLYTAIPTGYTFSETYVLKAEDTRRPIACQGKELQTTNQGISGLREPTLLYILPWGTLLQFFCY